MTKDPIIHAGFPFHYSCFQNEIVILYNEVQRRNFKLFISYVRTTNVFFLKIIYSFQVNYVCIN